MTALRDKFELTHKKDQFTYVQWSQVADRLDDVMGEGGWSFAIIGFDPGGEWAHGRLTLRLSAETTHYENIGYAENVAAEWKKEPLKDAVSDAFKRCAALAGVARYLYDKPEDAPARQERPVAPTPGVARPRPQLVEPDEEEANPFDDPASTAPIVRPEPLRCPHHPNREPRQNSRGYFCSGRDCPCANDKGYCTWAA